MVILLRTFVLLPERLACFTLAPSAPDIRVSPKFRQHSVPILIGHLRALLLRLYCYHFLNASYGIFTYIVIISHFFTIFNPFCQIYPAFLFVSKIGIIFGISHFQIKNIQIIFLFLEFSY